MVAGAHSAAVGGVPWRLGIATKCGSCSRTSLTYADDGSARCAACGYVTYPAWLPHAETVRAVARDREVREREAELRSRYRRAVSHVVRRLGSGSRRADILQELAAEGLVPLAATQAFDVGRAEVETRAEDLRRRSQRELLLGAILVPIGVLVIAAAILSVFTTTTFLIVVYYGPLLAGLSTLVWAWRDRRESRTLLSHLARADEPARAAP